MPLDSAREILSEGLMRARSLASSSESDGRLAFARAMAHSAIVAYWDATQGGSTDRWAICDLPASVTLARLPEPAAVLAHSIGIAAAALDVMEASHLIGVLYTATMPGRVRAELGAYYTPPALCERLLDMASEAGVDWRSARVLDPACGGGAFLSPVALRMARSLENCSPKIALKNILNRLRGFEFDPFAAWMSQVFLEVALADLCLASGTRLASVVDVCDSLSRDPEGGGFDLVIGNPPYGRTTLSPELRKKYRRSLYGHANLYGVFTDLALRFTRRGGVIAYVTPTSFLAGEYFKALRSLLGREAPPASIDFISERKGVFADVLQETVLAAYKRGGKPGVGQVHFIAQAPDSGIVATAAGSFGLPAAPDEPWLVPRANAHSKLVGGAQRMRHRLADYGYKVSTGPLVWNRHKPSLRDQLGKGRYPLIWAESVRSDGTFEFRAKKRNHQPYFEPQASETWVVTDFPCVLLQRTTAKEQSRRLIAAEMPDSFVTKHGGVVVENHLNMIRPVNRTPSVSLAALAALLNTAVVDAVFRCINGSVAVSAYELEALPLPAPEAMATIERLVKQGADKTAIEQAARQLYGEEAR
ncbi:MAG TPA: Eco57I restriction-modification methylase domain-containing protein [Alphaproteobacteria bacterium]|nr:Eco57I restriction-modification methylase domain-containing protein [Alphaproteobacteria bacterium]